VQGEGTMTFTIGAATRNPMQKPVAQLLFELELTLLQCATKADRNLLETLLAPDFFEFGTSGRTWNRAQIIEALARDDAQSATASSFKAHQLADDVFLVTFKTTRPGPAKSTSSLRSSIWKKRDGNWQLLFHQGTATES
jgi:hypothetical protein